MAMFDGKVAISGVGQSDIGRRLHRDPLDLTVDACLAAIEDAGLTRDDIDGIATYPGGIQLQPGFTGAGVIELQEALRLKLNWFAGGLEAPGQLGSVINACAAVATGMANHVVCFRTVWEGTAQAGGGRAAVTPGAAANADAGSIPRMGSFMQWTLPYAAPSAANWIAMMANRHFHEFGTTREHLGAIAINGRTNAALNPKAIYTDPMTMDDYLSARLVSWPFGLYDCDAPCDGSTAVIVSRADSAPDLRKPPLLIESVGTAIHGRPSWDQWDDLTTMALRDASAQLWTRTDLTAGGRRRGRVLRRLQLHRPVLARGALRRRRPGRRRSWRAAPTSPATACCPSTPTAASSPPAASTATASSTRHASSCGARVVSARSCAPGAAGPRSAWPPPVAVRSAAACSSPARNGRNPPRSLAADRRPATEIRQRTWGWEHRRTPAAL